MVPPGQKMHESTVSTSSGKPDAEPKPNAEPEVTGTESTALAAAPAATPGTTPLVELAAKMLANDNNTQQDLVTAMLIQQLSQKQNTVETQSEAALDKAAAAKAAAVKAKAKGKPKTPEEALWTQNAAFGRKLCNVL